MSEYVLKVASAEAQITLTPAGGAVAAHGILINGDAGPVAEYRQSFSGVCDTEIVTNLTVDLVFGRRINDVFIDMPQISAALEVLDLPPCDCDD